MILDYNAKGNKRIRIFAKLLYIISPNFCKLSLNISRLVTFSISKLKESQLKVLTFLVISVCIQISTLFLILIFLF